jgi:Protein of Unknown function (DUF2784)
VLAAAAVVVAVLHGFVVAFMVSGPLLALRWPRVLFLHVPVALAIVALYTTGSDCPLTTLELWLREGAGEPAYEGGFIGHYVTEPLGFPIRDTVTQIGVYGTVLMSNVLGYGLLVSRLLRDRAVSVPEQDTVSRRPG